MAGGASLAFKARDIKAQASSAGPVVKKALFFLPKKRLDLALQQLFTRGLRC
jgi:hypothetical protein